jgi:hypothetical protein
MLEGLDQIEWNKLHHAYGTAEDVPDLIRSLTHPSRDVRQSAYSELYGNLWHQGTIYEATAYAVPFLIEVAASESTPDRHEVLSYLGSLAEGSSFIAAHQNMFAKLKYEPEGNLDAELSWVQKTRDAVLIGEDMYLNALQSDQQTLACAAAFVLSRFPKHAGKFVPAIMARFDKIQTDTVTRCGLMILTANLASPDPAHTSWLLKAFEQEHVAVVRTAIATAAVSTGSADDDSIIAFLLDELLCNEKYKAIYSKMPWDVGEPIWYVVNALCKTRHGRWMLVSKFNCLLSDENSKKDLDYCRYVMQGQLDGKISDEWFNGPLRPLPFPDERTI